jgi:hypothetical protein
MNDIQFKLANVEVIHTLIEKVNADLISLGGIDDIEKTQMRSFIDATFKENYEPLYDSLLSRSMKNYFNDSTIKRYKDYEGYYKIEFVDPKKDQ